MTFADFVGNARALAAVQRMLAQGRLPAALLFAGPRGVGKFTLATLFARAANCLETPGEVCARCPNCRALAALEDLDALRRAGLEERGSARPDDVPLILRPHPCVSVLVPDPDYIRVAQMRHVVRQAYTAPVGGRRNVFLIDQADRLRFDFADVLLKVLEEPPEQTTLALVTAAPYELRPTIRSRCIPVHFGPLSPADIEACLRKHRPEMKKADRELAAAFADGSLGVALEMDLARFRETRAYAMELLGAAVGRDTSSERLFEATGALAGKTRRAEADEDTRSVFEFSLDMVYSLLTDILYSKLGASELGLRHPDLRSELQELGRRVSGRWLEEAVRQLDRVHGWQRRNINRQLALDAWALGSPVS